MRAWLLASILLCVIPTVASAQGLYLQKGTSGYGGSVGVATDGGFVSISADAGFSYRGWADAHLGVIGMRFEDDMGGAYGLAPGLAVHPLKQGPGMPLSVALGADVGFYRFSESSASAWSVAGWGVVYRFFKLGASWGVIPGVQFTYSHAETSTSWASAASDHVSVAIGGHVAWHLGGGYILTATPGIELSDDAPVFLFSVGAIRALP